MNLRNLASAGMLFCLMWRQRDRFITNPDLDDWKTLSGKAGVSTEIRVRRQGEVE